MSGALEVNIAFTFGLIGIGVGWNWGLKTISGFYDSASAVKYLLFGIILGTIYALLSDTLVLRDYLSFMRGEQLAPSINAYVSAFLISIATSLCVMLFLTRKSIIMTKSGPTSGWTLGLGIASMFAGRFSYLALDYYGFEFQSIIQILLFSLMFPLFEGALCCYQGLLSTSGQRLKSTIMASFGRFFFLMMIPAIFSLLIWWVIMIPIIMLMYRKSVTDWIPQSMTQDAKRRYRRIMADNLRRTKELANLNDFSEE